MKILYLDLGMGAAGDMLTAALLDSMNEQDKAEAIKEISSLNIPDVTFDVSKSVKCGITGTHVSVKVHGIDEGEGLHEHEHHHDELEHEHHHHEDFDHDHQHDYHEHDNEHHDELGHEHHNHDDFDHDHYHDHCHDNFDHDHEHPHDQFEHDHEHHHDHDHEHHHSHASLDRINNIVDNLNVSDQIKADVKSVYKIIAEAESHVHDKPITDIHFHEVGTMDAVADITAVCILIRKIGADKIMASPIHVGSGQASFSQ